MDHLLMLLLLLWSSGLQAEGQHDATGAQCESTDKADIVLLVDGSWSIGRLNFKRIRSFVAGIVSAFDIGPDRVQIGLAQYSGDPKTEWHLNTHQTKQSLLEAVANLPYKGGNTMTGTALNYILHNNFKPNVGMRADSQKIAVLITDGKSQDDILLPSQNLKDTGIEIYAIGVKNADKMELRSIASDPNKTHMYNVVDFPFLRDIVDDLIINLCNSTNLEPVRLVGGDSRCAGTLKLKQGEWRPVYGSHWTLTTAAVVCRELDCGPAVSIGMRDESSHKSAWEISSSCVQSGSALRECVSTGSSSSIMEITCSEAQAQLETPARLAKLLDSPAQVEEEQL